MPHPPEDRLKSDLAGIFPSNHNKGSPSLDTVQKRTIKTFTKKAEWFRDKVQIFQTTWNINDRNRPLISKKAAENYVKLNVNELPLFDHSGQWRFKNGEPALFYFAQRLKDVTRTEVRFF